MEARHNSMQQFLIQGWALFPVWCLSPVSELELPVPRVAKKPVTSECPSAADQKPESVLLRPRKARGAADGAEDVSG